MWLFRAEAWHRSKKLDDFDVAYRRLGFLVYGNASTYLTLGDAVGSGVEPNFMGEFET